MRRLSSRASRGSSCANLEEGPVAFCMDANALFESPSGEIGNLITCPGVAPAVGGDVGHPMPPAEAPSNVGWKDRYGGGTPQPPGSIRGCISNASRKACAQGVSTFTLRSSKSEGSKLSVTP